jgi:predicted ATPase
MFVILVVRFTALEPVPVAKEASWKSAVETFAALVEGQIERHGGRVHLRCQGQISALFSNGTPIECALEIYRRLTEQDWFLQQPWQQRIAIHAASESGEESRFSEEASDVTALHLAQAVLDTVPGPPILITPEAATHCLLPPATILRDLGVHPLPELNQLHKVLALSTDAPLIAHYYPLAPLVARATELAQINQWLHNPACRLLTIVGPGGAGKTHLALHAATRLHGAFAQGVFFVPLVVVSSTERLVPLIAATLNVPMAGSDGQPQPKGRLLEYLRAKEILLIIDNLEHLVAGAGLLQDLLAAAPGLKVLATSRERLKLAGEWGLEIGGLSFPPENVTTDTDIEAYGAVQLFISRARHSDAAFEISERNRVHVAHVCRLVQGLPLAIELAAAWVGALTCEQIAYQIEHNLDFLTTSRISLPERQRSLQAVFNYSWQLLSETERELFCRLSVFRGGFSRETAERITGIGLPLLARLADKSLLRRLPAGSHTPAAGRYEILGVLHTYAERELKARPQEAESISEQHCAYYTDFLERREKALCGSGQKQALEDVAVDLENIRAGWRWAADHGRFTHLDRSLHPLYLFYSVRGYYREGQRLLKVALAAVQQAAAGNGDSDPAALHLLMCRLLARLADFSSFLSETEVAERQIEESLSLARRYGNQADEAFALSISGFLKLNDGNYREARGLLQRSFDLYKPLDDRAGMAITLNRLGIVSRMLGDYDATASFYQGSLQLYRELGDQQGVAGVLLNLAVIIKLRGEYEAARQACQESLALFRAAGNQRGIVASLNNLGSLANETGAHQESWDYYQKSLAIRQEMGDGRGMALALVNLGEVADALGRIDEAKEFFRKGLKLAQKTAATPRALIALNGMARILHRQGYPKAAIEIVGFVLAQPALIQANREKAEHLLSELQSELDAVEVSGLIRQGEERSLEKTIELVLELL